MGWLVGWWVGGLVGWWVVGLGVGTWWAVALLPANSGRVYEIFILLENFLMQRFALADKR